MATTTVRIDEKTSEQLRELAATTGRSMKEVLGDAVDAHSRHVLLEQLNEDYAALRGDAKSWQEELEERGLWDATLTDDLEGN